MKLEAPEVAASSLASRDAARVIDQLEQENRALKNALVEAIETLDLPADENATEKQKRADREILALLRRMLYREDQVDVAPSRVAPTSGNPAGSMMSRDLLSGVLTRFYYRAATRRQGRNAGKPETARRWCIARSVDIRRQVAAKRRGALRGVHPHARAALQRAR